MCTKCIKSDPELTSIHQFHKNFHQQFPRLESHYALGFDSFYIMMLYIQYINIPGTRLYMHGNREAVNLSTIKAGSERQGSGGGIGGRGGKVEESGRVFLFLEYLYQSNFRLISIKLLKIPSFIFYLSRILLSYHLITEVTEVRLQHLRDFYLEKEGGSKNSLKPTLNLHKVWIKFINSVVGKILQHFLCSFVLHKFSGTAEGIFKQTFTEITG